MPTEAAPRSDTEARRTPGPAEMRAAMGRFASGVTVVTGLDPDGPAGFACQSFASVSLEPPLVLFCADHRGRAWPRIRTTGRFCVNVLAETQSDLCARFGSSRGAKFEGLEWAVSGWGTPALPGVLLRVHAEVYAVQEAGDHDVVTGRVLGLDTGEGPADPGGSGDPDEAGRPMVFYRGGFGLGGAEGAAAGKDGDAREGGTSSSPAFLPHLTWGWGDNWG